MLYIFKHMHIKWGQRRLSVMIGKENK